METIRFMEKEIESQSESKKRKITEDDRAWKLSGNANTISHLPIKIMYSVKEESKKQRETTEEIETNMIDDTNTKNSHLPLKVMCSVIEEVERIGVIETNTIDDTKNSHLPLKVMCSVIEEVERIGEIETNTIDDTNTNNSHLPLEVMSSVIEEVDRIGEIETNTIDDTNTKNSHLPLEVMCSVIEEKRKRKKVERIGDIESNPVDGKKIEDDVIGTRWKNSHVPMEIMCSVIEEKRREIERIREIDKVKSWEEKVIKKAEERMDFSGRVFIDDPRGLNSSTIADVKNLLQGKSHSELEVLQSDILLHMCSASVNDVEYWQTVLKLIYKYKVKACLKDVNDLRKTDEAEGTGSSCSPEILHREEIGDNFTMKTMGVMEDGDAFSSNNDEVILQSEVSCCHNRCRPRKSKYFNRVRAEYGWNNYGQTH